MDKLETIYTEVTLDEVMNYYSDAYKAHVIKSEHFIDTAKGIIIFKLTVKKEED